MRGPSQTDDEDLKNNGDAELLPAVRATISTWP
jgi:hypothetical protein